MDGCDKRWAYNIKRNTDWQRAGLAWITKDKFKLLSPKAKRCFVEFDRKWTPWQGTVTRYYCLVPRYYFVAAYDKAYITHIRIVDSELEAKTDELENQLLSNALYPYSWNAYGSWLTKEWRKRDVRKIRQRSKMDHISYEEWHYDQRAGKALT